MKTNTGDKQGHYRIIKFSSPERKHIYKLVCSNNTASKYFSYREKWTNPSSHSGIF